MTGGLRFGRKLFDIFTKIVIGAAFLFLAFTFFDVFMHLGYGSSDEDLETAGALAAAAVFMNLGGNWIYRLIERYGPDES